MTLPNQPPETSPLTDELLEAEIPASNSVDNLQEYRQLQQTLLLISVVLTGIIFVSVWLTYSPGTALNYLLGASAGMVYLKLLARDVEQLSPTNANRRLGAKGLALLAGLIIIASRWQQLSILTIFLGFLTYKAAIIVYTLKTVLLAGESDDG